MTGMTGMTDSGSRTAGPPRTSGRAHSSLRSHQRRFRRLVASAGFGLALGVLFLLGEAEPAGASTADNCGSLSDCYFVPKSAVTVTVGVGTVAVVLLLTPPIGGSPDVKPLDPGDVPPSTKPPKPAGPSDPKPPEPSASHGDMSPAIDHRPPPPLKPPKPGSDQAHPTVRVVEPHGVVERPVKPPRPAGDDAVIRAKVREAERAVGDLPRTRQKAVFEGEALAAGYEQHFKALTDGIRAALAPDEWIRMINPTGSQVNAVGVVNAVDAALAKVPRLGKPGGGALTAEALAEVHGSQVTQVTDLHEIGHFLAKAGPGARGVVAVQMAVPASWANAAPVTIGHAFNAGNVDGRVVFLDAQTGAVGATPHELLAAHGHDPASITSVLFVPTHPRLA